MHQNKSYMAYVSEMTANRTYIFKIKIAGIVPDNFEELVKKYADRYKLVSLAKTTTTPHLKSLTDFPGKENETVTNYTLEVSYPTTPTILRSDICTVVNLPISNIVVRTSAEDELNTETCEHSSTSLLTSQYPASDHQDIVGEKRISWLLADILKSRPAPTQVTGINDELLAKQQPTGNNK